MYNTSGAGERFRVVSEVSAEAEKVTEHLAWNRAEHNRMAILR